MKDIQDNNNEAEEEIDTFPRPDGDYLTDLVHGENRKKGKSRFRVIQLQKFARTLVTEIVNYNLIHLQQDIDALHPRDRVKLILEMAQYVLPKQKSLEHHVQDDREIKWNETRTYTVEDAQEVEEIEKNFKWTQEAKPNSEDDN